MTDQEKRIYNREHYLKNRSELLTKAKSKYKSKNQSPPQVIQLFRTRNQENEGPQAPKRRSIRLEHGTLFLLLLTVANTYFLVTETARFYVVMDGSWLPAYLKALILEGAVFAFSTLVKSRTAFAGILHKLMILLIYSYSIWAISGTVIQDAFQQQAQIEFHKKTVADLESEISKKVALRDAYFQANRITLASRIDQGLSLLKQTVEESRSFLSKSPNMLLVWNTLLTLILFRVLVFISNLFFLRELGRRFRLKMQTV